MVGIAAEERARMQAAAADLWGPGRRWTPGEIAWATITEPPGQVSFIGDGWAWRQDDYVAIVVTGVEEARAAVAWAAGDPVQLVDGDTLLLDALLSSGYRENVDAAYDLDVRLTARGSGRMEIPEGFVLRSARSDDDLVGVHRRSWRPSDLPFAAGHRPRIDEDATSSFSVDTMARIAASPLYRPDLHVVAEAPDGSLAGSCITWIDEANATAAIEPLGVVPEHRRRALAGALARFAAERAVDAGAAETIIHPRGDAAYPAARGAYRQAGFRQVGRTRIYDVG